MIARRPDPQSTGAYAGFEGKVGTTFAGSESSWPERNSPPAGAPNVIVMLADDLGFSDLGCYGSDIETPEFDRLAEEGLRFTNYHSMPMCSPTRAALLTGTNSHLAGVGHVAHSDPGFPGYAMDLADDVATAAEIFRDCGWATFMVGKWHLAKDSHTSAAGPMHSWPCQRGFGRFYGILDAFTNFHQPHQLVQDNTVVDVDAYRDDYYFTDDLTDHAIEMVRTQKSANPHQPFFLYFSHGAVHAPLQAKQVDIDKYRGRYELGWDALRSHRFGRQLALGLFPDSTVLPDRNPETGSDVCAWDDLERDQQVLYARYMEVYAGMVDNMDQNMGRLRSALTEMGEWDNTIVMFTSDNGASREGEEQGTTAYYTHLLGEEAWKDDHERLDLIGGPQTIPHYPRGWAMASNTPFRLYKVNAHAGGHQVPLIVSWGDRLAGGELRDTYVHVTDILPTLAELIGIDLPDERNGLQLKPRAGASFAPAVENAGAKSAHTEQYIESWGHRGFRRGDLEAVTCHQPLTPFGLEEWELFDLAADPTQVNDLAAERPDEVAALAAAWEEAAWANQVFPMEEGTMIKHIIRPEWVSEVRGNLVIPNGTPAMERWRSLQLIWVRDVTITAELRYSAGDEGVLVAHGAQGGGYVMYVEDGELCWSHHDGRRNRRVRGGPVPDGTRRIEARLTSVQGYSWNLELLVDDASVASEAGLDAFLAMAPFEGISVGRDPRSPVDWELFERHGSFAWTGDLTSVGYQPGELGPDSPERMLELAREMGAAFE